MESMWRDLRYALRALRKTPGFVLAVMLSLGLGIGANTAIFSLFNALILRPLPVKEPQRLIRIGFLDVRGFIQPIPSPMFDWLRKDPLLEGVCGVGTTLVTGELDGDVQPLSTHSLQGDCYETLGVRPAIGRLLTPDDDIPNGPHVVVLSYAFWHSQFALDPNVIGKSIDIEGTPFTVVGVTERRFQGLLLAFPPSVSFPITQEVNPARSDPPPAKVFYWANAFARLKPGVTQEQVQAHLNVEWRNLLDQSLPPRIHGAERDELLKEPPVVTSGATGLDYWTRNRYRRPLVALIAISALLLLVSCISIANLLLARGQQRQREIAVRRAFGAGRWQVAKELLIESALLIFASVFCALLFARGADRFLLAQVSRTYSGFALTAGLDVRVLSFAAVAAFVALLFFALVSARQAAGVNLTDALKSGSPSASSAQGHIRKILVCSQVAFTLALVLGASIFIQSLRHLRQESLGFQVEGVIDAQLMPLPGGYGDGFNGVAYYHELLDRMQFLPSVEAASLAQFSPLFTMPFKQEISQVRHADAPVILAPAEPVSDGFLATMRIPLLQGQDFRRTDTPQSPKTAIVSLSLAKRLFPSGDALGQHLRIGSENDTQDVEIVGIAADARVLDPRTDDPAFVYLNFWQYPRRQEWGDLQLRFSGDMASLSAAVRRVLRDAGHEYTLHLRSVADQRDISLLQERLLAYLGIAFGMLALILAGVGLSGLLSFLVAARTKEFGIRVALGAKLSDLAWAVIRETLELVGAGLFLGLPLSYAVVRILSGLIYGVGPLPVIPAVISVALLSCVATVAAVIPVRRATSVDPMVALRYE